jgi:hypothetical protein
MRSPHADIKWIRLQEICLDIAGPDVSLHVHGSTDVPPNLQAAVSREGQRIDILLNLLYNKTLEDVIENLAHEMAHLVLGYEGHGVEFDREWARLRTSITREYHKREVRP